MGHLANGWSGASRLQNCLLAHWHVVNCCSEMSTAFISSWDIPKYLVSTLYCADKLPFDMSRLKIPVYLKLLCTVLNGYISYEKGTVLSQPKCGYEGIYRSEGCHLMILVSAWLMAISSSMCISISHKSSTGSTCGDNIPVVAASI